MFVVTTLLSTALAFAETKPGAQTSQLQCTLFLGSPFTHPTFALCNDGSTCSNGVCCRDKNPTSTLNCPDGTQIPITMECRNCSLLFDGDNNFKGHSCSTDYAPMYPKLCPTPKPTPTKRPGTVVLLANPETY